MSLTVSSFFHYFMFHPEKLPEKQNRIVAMVSTIALGVITLGLTHLICYFALYNRKVVPVKAQEAKTEDKKTQVVAKQELVDGKRKISRKKSGRRKRTTKKWLKKFSSKELPVFVKYKDQGHLSFHDMKEEALRGNVEYQLFVGQLFLLGKSGVPKSNSNAFFWYSKAAENKNPLGLYRAGKMYYRGFGVEKDKDRGLQLLREAVIAGSKTARSYLRKIESKQKAPPLSAR